MSMQFARFNEAYPPSVPVALPPGWECKFDSTTQKYFYIDHVNKKTQWTPPTVAPRYNAATPTATAAVAKSISPYASKKSRDPYQQENLSSSRFSTSASSSSSSDSTSNYGRRATVTANPVIKRRLQLKYNANTPHGQQMIEDALIKCNNNESEAIELLKEKGMTAKANNLTKPQMAPPKTVQLNQEQKDIVLRKLKVRYGDKLGDAEMRKVAEKHNYNISAIQTELSKLKSDINSKNEVHNNESPSYSSIVYTDYESSTGTGTTGYSLTGNTADQNARPATGFLSKQGQAQSKNKTKRVFASSDADLSHDRNSQSDAPYKKSNSKVRAVDANRPRARSSSSGYTSGRALGPDPSLRSNHRQSIVGPTGSCIQLCETNSTRKSLARGPSVVVLGANRALLNRNTSNP